MVFHLLAPARRAACGLLLAGSVWAFPAAASSEADLATAVRAAWAAHPAAEATERALAAARARAQAAGRPLYNPELEIAVEDQGDERTTTAGLGWTLDVSGKRRARAALGDAELTLTGAEAALRRATFVQQWLRAWADRLAADERVRVGEQRLQLVERFANLAERQQAVGDLSALERDLALLARAEAQAEQATLLSEAASAHEAFRAVGGQTVPPVPRGAPPALEARAWRLATVADARVAEASAASAARRVTVSQRDRRPDPTLRVTTGRIELGPASDNVVGMAVSVPLFVRNTFGAEVIAAQADADAALAEQRRILLEVDARAERAERTYAAVRAAWLRWTDSPGTDVAQRADLLERLWRAGELSTADYLIQLKQSLDTALAGAELQGRLWRSYVDALHATGQLEAWAGFETTVEVTP